jgi:hypothetical protein
MKSADYLGTNKVTRQMNDQKLSYGLFMKKKCICLLSFILYNIRIRIFKNNDSQFLVLPNEIKLQIAIFWNFTGQDVTYRVSI